jgi:signal transduction histidine kinase
MATMSDEENGLEELRRSVRELHSAVDSVKSLAPIQTNFTAPAEAASWNFTTFEKYINQRFGDLSLQLRERYEAQQTGVTAALAAAEKAVNAALIAAEKAVDKAEGAQQLRNEAQNEFRKSLSDLSGLMWTIKEGTATVEALRREFMAINSNVDKQINDISKTVETRVRILESMFANIQGRIWAISGAFALAASVLTAIIVAFLEKGFSVAN